MLDRADETRLRIKHLFSYLDVCSCFKASGPNCFLTFSLEIHRQKHFLTVKLKIAAKTTGPGLYYRGFVVKHLRTPTKTIEMQQKVVYFHLSDPRTIHATAT